MKMTYETLSISPELKKKLYLLKIKKGFKTWDKLIEDIIKKYKVK